jgi:predicted RNase H-like nuclease (RuvC/YqgF family)
LPFTSLKPWDLIPLDIKVVITTKEESQQVSHPKILLFNEESNPETVVDEAMLIVQGKRSYERVVVGVDPGKTYGIALLGDDKVLETLTSSILEEAVNLIVECIKRFPTAARVVRVGRGPPEYTKRLIRLLNENLPEETMMEIVSEAGTSHLMNESVNRRGLRDAVSAIEIARRNGKTFSRKNVK